MGAVDGLSELAVLQKSICIQDGVAKEQILDDVASYLVNNAEMAIGPSALIVMVALRENYPC
ncbi:Rap1a/Tai family immunity protein [Halomonas cupida]|uniref:Rap1a/Tai family immunity protein n=1 Tax=Halomonas cupida TaxID=44933 RepID=UPI003EF66431